MSEDAMQDETDLKGMEFDEATRVLLDTKGARGIVQKKPDQGGKWSHCFTFRPGEYSEAELLDTIVTEFGPGVYPVTYKSPDDRNAMVFRWVYHYSIQPKRPSLRADASPPSPPSRDDSSTAMIASLLEQNTRVLQSLVEKLSSTPPPEKPKDTIEVAKDLAALKELFTTEKTSPMESIKEVLEVMQLLQANSGANDESALTLAIKTLLPAITAGTEEMRKREVTRPDNREPDVIPAGAPTPAAMPDIAQMQQAEALAVDQAYAFFIKNFLTPALELARAGQEPKDVADYISRLAGSAPGMLDMIGRVIAEDDMVERLAKADRQVLDYAGWFDLVADWLAHAQWPETNPAPVEPSATKTATPNATKGANGIKAANAQESGGGPDDAEVTGASEDPDTQRPPGPNDP